MKDLRHIRFEIPRIDASIPVIIIGAGGIVKDAHLPAYQLAGINVKGVFDLNSAKAEAQARQFEIPIVYTTMEQLVAENKNNCIYDVAVPGNQIVSVLSQLPEDSFVLMQKPMGENEQQADEILRLCRRKNITAGVNFQMRYAPYILMAKQMMAEGLLGQICDFEIYVNVYTPWDLWDFLRGAERVEILYHSIHYIDLIRNMLGEPKDIFAKTVRHPKMAELQEVKSNIIMDYGEFLRVNINTNHCHGFGLHNQDAFVKIEGTKGAVKIKLGLLMNYPKGIEDTFECILSDEPTPSWTQLPIKGSWFPHAFIGSMYEMIKTKQGIISRPDNAVEDSIKTMRLVEKAYDTNF
ncbi:MAG TPA: Gfo/Idh/MocA family oxidoreductase [Agriterribacter sp.]|nr:Gfo/Idh/MocA family oxidoreductase [Agriterribacter sp.]